VRIEKIEEKAGELAFVPARMALGATMAYHGASKLTPSGLQQHAGMFEQMGFRPGKPYVIGLGAAELFAGVSSLLGLGTRAAALAVLVTQPIAIAKVHAKNGFPSTKGGFEFNLALIAMALGLLAAGPGRVSANRVLEKRVLGKRTPRFIARRRRPFLAGLLAAIR